MCATVKGQCLEYLVYITGHRTKVRWRSCKILWPSQNTLYNAILRTPRNFLETRENVKILTHPFYHINLSWFSREWSKKKFFFFEKKIQNGRLKKSSFFKIANSQNFFAKISEIGPWISRIEWCEGHWCSSTYMAVRLSDKSLKTAKKYRKCIFWKQETRKI